MADGVAVLLAGGERSGERVDAVPDGYHEWGWWGLPDPEKRWDGESTVPRVAVSFAVGFPTIAELAEMLAPKVPDDMHAALQDAWARFLRSRVVVTIETEV